MSLQRTSEKLVNQKALQKIYNFSKIEETLLMEKQIMMEDEASRLKVYVLSTKRNADKSQRKRTNSPTCTTKNPNN